MPTHGEASKLLRSEKKQNYCVEGVFWEEASLPAPAWGLGFGVGVWGLGFGDPEPIISQLVLTL